MLKTFVLYETTTTRDVNDVCRKAIRQAVKQYHDMLPVGTSMNWNRHRPKGGEYYSFGMGYILRDTLVAIHEPGSGLIKVVFPNDYKGWDRSDFYTRTRVRAYDLILHHSGLINPMGKLPEGTQ